jgi:hypothetical protein
MIKILVQTAKKKFLRNVPEYMSTSKVKIFQAVEAHRVARG